MKPGQESKTAVMVCLARAVAHGHTSVAEFSDPTARALLPPEALQRLEAHRAMTKPQGLREGFSHAATEVRAKMMVARTVAIDRTIREAANPQVVILGAGLDGRAWRMAELKDAVVFEIDHPASQREKRARVAALPPIARDVRFVPVDFTCDDLDPALAAAGHDPSVPTTWVWEGVVMYLSKAEVDATLAVIARRSAASSRLSLLYSCPAPMLMFVGLVLGRIGEPLRSAFRAPEMKALLFRHGFAVQTDEDLPAIGAALSRDLEPGTRTVRHLRLATAVRR